jgi:hypothetical protein
MIANCNKTFARCGRQRQFKNEVDFKLRESEVFASNTLQHPHPVLLAVNLLDPEQTNSLLDRRIDRSYTDQQGIGDGTQAKR